MILEIDWSGKLIKKYILDQEVNMIALRNDEFIYCLKEELNNSTLYKYSLK